MGREQLQDRQVLGRGQGRRCQLRAQGWQEEEAQEAIDQRHAFRSSWTDRLGGGFGSTVGACRLGAHSETQPRAAGGYLFRKSHISNLKSNFQIRHCYSKLNYYLK